MAGDDSPREVARRTRERVHGGGARAAQAGRGTWRTAERVTAGRRRYNAKHVLTAELLAGLLIVVLRAVADYEPQADGTLKGKIGHPQGQYGPLPILAGLVGTFFLLSFLAARGGERGKVAVVGGGLIIVVLGMKSTSEISKVAATFGSFGKGKVAAGNWQTSGDAAGAPITGSNGGGGAQVPAGGPMPKPSGKTCPPGYGYYKGKCYPLASSIQPPAE